MPQMSPLYWLTLMILFLMIMLIINTMMYFNKKYNTKMSIGKKVINNINWKW